MREGLEVGLLADPPAEFRGGLGQRINAFHSASVPFEAVRFGLEVTRGGVLVAGLSGVMSWGWLFVEALWVDAALRGQGVGRELMARAEAHALASGCHGAWLDSFQAVGFYQALGYARFGALEDYPAGQTRVFLRKSLRAV